MGISARCGKAVVVIAALGLSLAGCTSLEVLVGTRERLDKVPVTGLTAVLVPGPALAPGKSAGLVITAATADGKTYVTAGVGQGKVLFDSFRIVADVVTVSPKGIVSLSADPRGSEHQTPHLLITAIGHPDVAVELAIPIRYDVAFSASLVAAAGSSGSDGMDGTDGMAGSMGSSDGFNPSPGGNGGSGGNGWAGGDGSPGEPGPNLHVWLTPKPGVTPPLIEARVAGSGADRYFLIDPDGGSLAVTARGGPGGGGGRGGRGGRGGSGGSGIPPGFSGADGLAGSDGHTGPGGRAGSITVSVDPAAAAFLGQLTLHNLNGDGVPGPDPTIVDEPVPPLW